MRIMLVAGASGGHIFPALSFLEALEEAGKQVKTLLVLPRVSIGKQLNLEKIEVCYLPVSSIKLRLDMKNILALAGFLLAFLRSLRLLLKFHPDMVIGFGSLVSFPVIVLARLMGIKTLLHEQNVIPGRANRLLAGLADKIAVSFQETVQYLPRYKKKIIFTGNPLRRKLKKYDRNQALDFFKLKDGVFTILVMGGSQGSHKINSVFIQAISSIPELGRCQVIHLCGLADYDGLLAQYKKLAIESRLFKFFDAMQYAYSASDLAISRAGATTIAELIFFKIPALLVPYPFAYSHQQANALVLEDIGSASIIRDNALEIQPLKELLMGLINNPDRMKSMRSGYERLNPYDAKGLFRDSVLSMISR